MKLFKRKPKVESVKISVGDHVAIDSGILGTSTGILVSIDGFSPMGWFGTYKEDGTDKFRNFDQFSQIIKFTN